MASIVLPCLAEANEVTIHGRKIGIAAPAGFAEVSTLFPERFELRKKLVMPGYKLHAWFVELIDGRPATRAPYRALQVQSLLEPGKSEYSASEFGQVLNEFKKILKEPTSLALGIDEMRKKITQLSASIDFDGITPLGILAENDEYVVLALLTTVRNGGKTTRTVSGLSMCLIRGQLVFLYLTSRSDSRDELQWIKDVGTSWAQQLRTNNP